MKNDCHYFTLIAFVRVCGRRSMMVFKGLEPSFSGNHGNRTLRSTGRDERGGGGGKRGRGRELWGVGLASVSCDKMM